MITNVIRPLKRFRHMAKFISAPVISVSESDLWNPDDNDDNWLLTAGKIQNLRLAVKKVHGIEVNPNEVFSFWRHIGNPNLGQGYVVGREIREGCIIPTIAGGLCQLSNALYDACLKANFTVVERHRHSKVIKGSLAEQNRDATVKWNYLDLQFKSDHPFRIEAELSSEKLIIRFKSTQLNARKEEAVNSYQAPSILNDCYSCGNFECFKHPERRSEKKAEAHTTFILDERWKEFDDYINDVSRDVDSCILPFTKNGFFSTTRYRWGIKNLTNIRSVPFQAAYRALNLRIISKTQQNVFSEMLRLDEHLARAMSRKIPIESTHLVVSQNLLPFLWKEGVFGGRTFDVLMTRLPLEKLHERLDDAHHKFPQSKTLNDFRASRELIELENTALTKARKIITPHKEIADIFSNKCIRLQWSMPKATAQKARPGTKILFPASALGRKGAYEIKRLAKDLGLTVVVMGKASEAENFWEGVKAQSPGANLFDNISLVVYPTYIEHQPRILLKAIANGIPVIATTACGLEPSKDLVVVPTGDYDLLKVTVTLALERIAARAIAAAPSAV